MAELVLLLVAVLTALQSWTLLPYRMTQAETGLAAQELRQDETDGVLQELR